MPDPLTELQRLDQGFDAEQSTATLVERLREGVLAIGSEPGGAKPLYAIVPANQAMRQAAATIEAQQAVIAGLASALERLLSDMHEATGGGMSWITHDEVQEFKRRARTALTKEPDRAE